MHFAILGAGSWGTALALQLCRTGNRVTLVSRRLEHALALGDARENQDYLPGFKLPESLQIGCEVGPAVMEAEVVFLACPLVGLAENLRQLAAVRGSAWALRLVVTLCKGLDPATLERPGEMVARALPGLPHGALSGPSGAPEVAANLPCAMVLAVEGCQPPAVSLPGHPSLPDSGPSDFSRPENHLSDARFIEKVQEILSHGRMRVYRSEDLTGVELAGALKNPFAIGAGICDGLQAGASAKAAYLTRALAEMRRVGTALGGQTETFTGLAGLGDLVATANAPWSRNRSFGEALALGHRPEELLAGRKSVVEGYPTVAAFHHASRRLGLDAPILEQIYAICYQGQPAHAAIDGLLRRPLKEE